MKVFRRSTSIAALLVCAKSAQAATVLPMLYLPDNVNLNLPSPDSQLLLGAFTEMDAEGKITVKASKTIYVAPKQASVRAAKAKIYPVANCPVVNQAIGDEQIISQLFHDNLELLKSYGEEVKTYYAESKSARAECLAAKKAKAPDAEDKCSYSSDVSDMLKDITGELKDWTSQITDASDAFQKRYESIASQPGGYTVAIVQLWNADEIKKVKDANPDYSTALVPFKKVNFTLTTAEEGLLANEGKPFLKTVLGFSIAGQTDTPAGGSEAAKAQVLSGSNVSLGVTLSRFGACDSSLIRGATFHYDYDAFAFVHGIAMINRWQLYERVEENTSKGGFFTTKAVHKLHEDLQAGNIHSVLVDGVPDKDFALATEQLSAAVLEDMVREIGDATNVPANPAEVVGLPAPSANGASVAADGLSKCPNIYCQVGSWGLKTLGAVFGGQTNKSEIKKAYDKKVRREYGYTTHLDGHDSSSTIVVWDLKE